MELLESGYDWDYPIEPQESGNSYMRHARAKVLGGCSSHNSAIAFWAPKENLDDWAASGATGWSAEECYPFYRKLETALDTTEEAEAPGRGTDGPVTIRTVGRPRPVRRGAAGGVRAGRAPDDPVQHRAHGAARRELVPGQREDRRLAVVGVGGLHPPEPRAPQPRR